MNKRILSKLLIAALCSSMLSGGNIWAAETTGSEKFSKGSLESVMTYAVSNGLLASGENNTGAKMELTRAELGVIIARAFGAEKEASMGKFSDVSVHSWYYSGIAKAVEMGILAGNGDKIYPDRPVTKQEAIVALSRAFELENKDISELSKFKDAGNIGAWAAPSVAAMVKAGYVSGNEKQQLCPQQKISKQELAQLIYRMAAGYAKDKTYDETIDGSLMVRTNGTSLKDMRIKGDLIIADGVNAEATVMDNVTIDGRILIRGNADLQMINSRAQKMIISRKSKGGSVVIDKGSTVTDIQANAAVNISGMGNVKNITANADNIKILISGANVSAAPGVKGVKAGEKTLEGGKSEVVAENVSSKDSEKQENNSQSTKSSQNQKNSRSGSTGSSGNGSSGSGSSGNGSSGSGSTGSSGNGSSGSGNTETGGNTGSSGSGNTEAGENAGSSESGSQNPGGSNPPAGQEKPETVEAAIADSSKAVVIASETGTWLPLVFNKGYKMDQCSVEVDGTDVTAAMSPVTSDGSIAKLPLTGIPGRIDIKTEKQHQKIELGVSSLKNPVYMGNGYLPDYIVTHGTIPAWDYYLTNYDEEGNIRIQPKKTTFSLNKEQAKHPGYSPDAELKEDGTGEAVIMFNYNTEQEKAWFDGITKLELVQYNENKNTINDHLIYATEADVSHGSGKVGELRIALGQDNFRTNGRYYIRVKSAAGTSELVPVHIVNEVTPVLKLKENAVSGRNLHMQVENMVYGITQPVENVTLTDPSGNTRNLDMISDWYLIGDLFVLYNDVAAENGRNNLRYNGNYTITLYSNGFKPVSKTFNVTGGEEIQRPQVSMMKSADVVTHASSMAGSGSSGESGSGGMSISANLMFKSDLITNALILDKLGMQTEESTAVVDYWYNVITDYALDQGADEYYSWTYYMDAVNDGKVSGEAWVPFASYVKNGRTTPDRPYSVKEVLEDGLLGDIQTSRDYGRFDAPEWTMTGNKQGSDVVLTFADKEYLSKITALYLNGDWKELDKNLYQLDLENGTLTIKSTVFQVGNSCLVIDAAGYKSLNLKFDYQKVNEENLALNVLSTFTEGEDVIVSIKGSDGDFLKNLSGITLCTDEKEDTIWPKGVEGETACYYTLSENTIVLHQVKPGSYILKVSAKYYDEVLEAAFTVTAKAPDSGEEEPKMPAVSGHTYMKKSDFWDQTDYYRLTFTGLSGKELDSYLGAVTEITVGGRTYSKPSFYFAEDNYRAASTEPAYSTLHDCIELAVNGFNQTGSTTVIIKAAGYDDVTYTLTLKDEKPDHEETPDIPEIKTAPEIKQCEHKTQDGDNTCYRLAFQGDEAEVTAYLNSIKAVSVNGMTYEKAMYYLRNNSYLLTSSHIYGSDYIYLDLSEDAFYPEGDTQVVITADGYEDLIYTITAEDTSDTKDPGESKDQESKTVPDVDEIVLKKGLFDHFYRVTFGRTDQNEVTAFLNAITSVTVNQKGYTRVYTSFWNDTLSYKLSPDEATGGDNIYLDLTADGFSQTENAEIIIQAAGYDDLIYNYQVQNE